MTLDGVELNTPPSSVPRILAGVRGPKSLALAGRSADGTILAEPVTPEYVAEALRHIAPTREHRIVAYCVAVVDDDADAARDAARPALEWIGDPDWDVHIAPLPFADEFRALRAGVGDPRGLRRGDARRVGRPARRRRHRGRRPRAASGSCTTRASRRRSSCRSARTRWPPWRTWRAGACAVGGDLAPAR